MCGADLQVELWPVMGRPLSCDCRLHKLVPGVDWPSGANWPSGA